MGYKRVIPRDLFNEAKFLKCIGKLSLAIHDNKNQIANHLTQVLEDESSGFQISQIGSCGGLFLRNYFVFNKDATPVYLKSILNSKLNYPLLFEFKDEEEFVFDDYGNLSKEFLSAISERGY